MSPPNVELELYLERIGFKDQAEANLETLKRLQTCHSLNVPYENLDVLLHVPIILKRKPLFDKIVTRKRGGWCHELNGLFWWALKEIGFDVCLCSGRFRSRDGKEWCADFDHMVLLVRFGPDVYYSDVGMGHNRRPLEPMLLTNGTISLQRTGAFKLSHDPPTSEWSLSTRSLEAPPSQDWEFSFKFTTQQYDLDDFQELCSIYQQGLDPREDLLPSTPVVFLSNKNDHSATYLIIGNKFRAYRNVGLDEKETFDKIDEMSEEELRETLANVFGILIPRRKLNGFFRHVPKPLIRRALQSSDFSCTVGS